jgi:hypothetical protein
LTYFTVKTYVTSNNKLGLELEFLTLAQFDSFTYQTQRPVTSMYSKVAFVTVLLRTADLAINFVSRYQGTYTATQGGMLSSGTKMDIPDSYGGSSYYGFQGYCAIGLQRLFFGGDGSTAITRSILFNQDTNPFNSVENTIGGGG